MTHGRYSTYSHGCRCDECRAAHAAYKRARYQPLTKDVRASQACPKCRRKLLRDVRDGFHWCDGCAWTDEPAPVARERRAG